MTDAEQAKANLRSMINDIRREAAEKLAPLHDRYRASEDSEDKRYWSRQMADVEIAYREAEKPLIKLLMDIHALEPMPPILVVQKYVE
jgi:hypothetical protein